jgi:hypothetical protein
MSMVKAVCKCKDMSEDDLAVAIKEERFAFIQKWGFWTWVFVIMLTLLTGGIWLLFIAIYYFKDILNPKYICNQCSRSVSPNQFRL